jgi:hypothetical protein
MAHLAGAESTRAIPPDALVANARRHLAEILRACGDCGLLQQKPARKLGVQSEREAWEKVSSLNVTTPRIAGVFRFAAGG